MARRSPPTSRAISEGTGGSSPLQTGAIPPVPTGATNNSDFSGLASTISQVLPTMTNLLGAPSVSSPESFRERTNASSTDPIDLRVTTSRTVYLCSSGIIDRCSNIYERVRAPAEVQPSLRCSGTNCRISLRHCSNLLDGCDSISSLLGLSAGRDVPSTRSLHSDGAHSRGSEAFGSSTSFRSQRSSRIRANSRVSLSLQSLKIEVLWKIFVVAERGMIPSESVIITI